MRAASRLRVDLTLVPHEDFQYPRLSPVIAAGGAWSPTPDTFFVDELPKYDLCGEGEHAAVVVEKKGRTTREVAKGVAARLGLPTSAVGYAGMKDKACVSVQAFTVAGVQEDRARVAFEGEGCRVLRVSRHRNKLRLGHLAGNRFRAFLDGADSHGVRSVLQDLDRTGAPNYYGPQRFGARGDNALQGLAVLRGKARPSRWKRDLLVSALQSLVFNEVLARRIEQGAFHTALDGDVLRREDSGGLFVCVDPATDAPRVRAFEVSPTGPMPGRKMVHPRGEVAAAEAAVMADLNLDETLFFRETGARRALRIRLQDWSVEAGEGGAWTEFTCPAGAYASSVIREITG